MHIASLGFDISVWEMVFPIFAGASLVIASTNQKQDIISLSNLIIHHRVTILHFVPSLLKLFLDSSNVQKCISLNQVVTGGETLSTELRDAFFSKFKKASLYLAYGPTEAAISVTHWNCCTKEYKTITPIGRPISNIQIYILNPSFNLVPVGVSGEIYIGGMGLARGYLRSNT